MTGSLFSVALTKAVVAYLLMAIIAMGAAGFIHGLVAFLERSSNKVKARQPEPAAAAAKPAAPAKTPAPKLGLDPAIVAVISAAVAATLGGQQRIVHIGESKHADGWKAEGLIRHHVSHTPHQ